MEQPKPVTVFLADDHPLLRMGLSLAFNAKDNIRVVGESDNGFDAIEKIKKLVPDVALLDIDMPGLSGTAAIRVLRKIFPHMTILVLSTYNDENYIRDAMSSGANGYILKTVDIDILVDIITSFHEGREILSPYLLDFGIRPQPQAGESDEDPSPWAAHRLCHQPARDLGPRIAHAILPMHGKGSSDWGYALVPVIGPCIGGVIAALIYRACWPLV